MICMTIQNPQPLLYEIYNYLKPILEPFFGNSEVCLADYTNMKEDCLPYRAGSGFVGEGTDGFVYAYSDLKK